METDEKLRSAFWFAEVAHGDQHYGNRLYSYHLEAVVRVLRRFGYGENQDLLVAAVLHDVIEDTATNYNDVKKGFGEKVAELVYAVTDELGRNRKDRHAKTYPKTAKLPEAVVLKLADRIANVEHSIETKDQDKLGMYLKEHVEFWAALHYWPAAATFPAPEPMWDHLDRLLGTTMNAASKTETEP
jgi:(p)ppGpp synthase/HD superfamily hydrolase